MKRLLQLTITSLLLFLAVDVTAQEIANFQNPSKTVVSPEVHGDSVTFRLDATYATVVTVKGSFLQPGSDPVPMHKDRSGMWEKTFVGVFPDLHTYSFEVDGVQVQDPANCFVKNTGDETVNMFFVEGPRTQTYHPAQKRGTVSYVSYHSNILRGTRRMAVYLPYGYDPLQKKSYPVLYLLHGKGQNEESWLSIGYAENILDNLIQSGRAVPMIVVMPDCNVEENATFSNVLVNEIIPYVESHYNVLKEKLKRGIAGVDSGGHKTYYTVINHPDLFDYIIMLGSGVKETPTLINDLLRVKRAKFKLIWQGCGAYDFQAIDDVKRLYDGLQTVDMDNTYFMSNGGHEWRNWRLYFSNFIPMLFKY